jgi:hypothetical protein
VCANARAQFDAAPRFMDEAEARLRAMGFGPTIEVVTTAVYGTGPELWLGRYAAAEARSIRLLGPARARKNRYVVAELCPSIALSRLYRGDLAGAKAALAEAPREILDGPPTLPKVNLRRAEAEVLIALGDPRAVERYDDFTRDCAHIIAAPAWLRVEIAQLGLKIALALGARGEPGWLKRGRSHEKPAIDAATPARLARSLRLLAEIDLAAGDPLSARARLAAAEASLARQEAPHERAALLCRRSAFDSDRCAEAEEALAALGAAHPSVYEPWWEKQ